jgi:zinc protease
VKELRRRAHETSLKDNGYWLEQLSSAYRFGDDPKLIIDFDTMTNKVTSDRVRAAAKKYLTQKEYVLGELRPESVKPAP